MRTHPVIRKVFNMATKRRVQLVDDLDGKEIPEGEGETVRLGIDGRRVRSGSRYGKTLRSSATAWAPTWERLARSMVHVEGGQELQAPLLPEPIRNN